jgi:single-strand DNA-binding protein
MQGVNKVIFIGTLGKDPEVKKVGENTVVNFSIATSERYKDRNGQNQEKTEWHNLVAWGKLAELIGRTLKKGKAAYFEGKLTTRSWDDPQGNKRYATEVLVKEMSFISRSETAQGGQQPTTPQQQQFQQPQPQQTQGYQQQQFQQPQQQQQNFQPSPPPQQGQPQEDSLPF